MMFFHRVAKGFAIIAPFFLLLSNTVSAQECDSVADCPTNWDCARTGLLRKKRCFPISCVTGAANAMEESGFNAQVYLDDIKTMTGLTRNRDFLALRGGDDDSDASNLLAEAFATYPVPHLDVFQANYSACASPTTGERHLQFNDGEVWPGLQVSVAALFSYFYKQTWWSGEFVGRQVSATYAANCIGALVGADVGVDLLLQVYSGGTNAAIGGILSRETISSSGTIACVPVTTIAIFGIQVCWNPDQTQGDLVVTEITFGPSLGVALGGYSSCFATQTVTF
ncbi:expressed unknown protein [Seminavis robusta]|uniref:Uncharacterized protein n=1 Tax=Seminavis robusta TaxID=568900 RepID=A0A9N8HQU6_9STRA|nr:expressed unknown protein [Seminavis robusta]|eukprot:Sro1327_g263110.1 n/a (282) ;mRNA; f:22670-23619